jgi:hypothetical protein
MIVIGTVAGPEDNELLQWAEHWKNRGRLLILIQGTAKWFGSRIYEELQKIAPDSDIIPVLPVGNPDVHWNSLMTIASAMDEYEGLLIKGTDEYMTDACWDAMVTAVNADPGAMVFWIYRKDMFDGNHFDEMPGDYQPTFVRGVPMRFGVHFHQYPQPACPVDLIRYLPDTIYVEHRRSAGKTIKANRDREKIARPQEANIQNTFLTKLFNAYKARGLKWPEEQK